MTMTKENAEQIIARIKRQRRAHQAEIGADRQDEPTERANGHAAEVTAPPQDDWQPPAEIPNADATPAIEPPPPAKRFTPVAIDDVTLSAEPAWAIHRLLQA